MSCRPFSNADGSIAGIACLNVEPEEFERGRIIAVGFGSSGIFRDGVMVEDGEAWLDADRELTGEHAEKLAAADPEHRWEIVINGPMSGAVYRREGHEIGRWLCVQQLGGFA